MTLHSVPLEDLGNGRAERRVLRKLGVVVGLVIAAAVVGGTGALVYARMGSRTDALEHQLTTHEKQQTKEEDRLVDTLDAIWTDLRDQRRTLRALCRAHPQTKCPED